MTGDELANRSTHELLGLYSRVLRELVDRGVVRTLNAPAGDLAETIVSRAYDGELAPNSEKSWDVRSADGRLLQVKSRVIGSASLTRPIAFSVFRSWDFHAAVFVVLAAETYDVVGGFEVPTATIRNRATAVSWVGGMSIRPSLTSLRTMPDAIDVTERLHAALLALP
jgi:hypothetical protein